MKLFAVASGVSLIFAACGDSSNDGNAGGDDASVSADAGGSSDALEADAAMPLRCSDLETPATNSVLTIESGGRTRVANVHVPASYDSTVATPVVLNFHGYSSTANQQAALSRMISKSETEGFIVVHATGVGALNSWNGGACCGTAASQDVDDVAFVSDLIDALAVDLCVDPARIYATGLSNGGFLSHRLACELSDRIAAIASVAGVIGIDTCAPTRPMPVMHFHGTSDGVVPYNGNALIGYIPVAEVYDRWAEHNSCTGEETTFDEGDASCVSGTGCAAGGAITLCTITGGGHTWPGGIGGVGTSTDISATDEMWDFFVAHPHPAP